jgi:hypothetical protein
MQLPAQGRRMADFSTWLSRGGAAGTVVGDRAARGKRSPHGKTSPSRSNGLGMEEHLGAALGQQRQNLQRVSVKVTHIASCNMRGLDEGLV